MPSAVNKNVYYYLFVLLFSITALVDSVNGFALRTLGASVSVGELYRGWIMIITFIISLMSFRNTRFPIGHVVCYYLITNALISYYFHSSVEGLVYDLRMIFKIIYIVLIIESFKNLFDRKVLNITVVDKILNLSMLFFPLCLIVPKLLGYGYPMYESTGAGYSGFFVAANDLNIVLGVLLIVSLDRLFTRMRSREKYFYYLICSMMILVSSLFLGSKSSIIIGALATCVFIFREGFLKGSFNHRVKYFIFLVFILGIAYFVIQKFYYYNFVFAINNILYKYYVSDSIFSFLLSNRDDALKASFASLLNSDDSLWRVIFGSGTYRHTVEIGVYSREQKMIEMDIFDVFFSYGAIGFMLIYSYFLSFIKGLVKVDGNDYFRFLFSYGLLAAFSCVAGHVLFSALAGTYLAIICCGLYASKKIDRKSQEDHNAQQPTFQHSPIMILYP